ncbi:integral membrane [Pyrenophora seminiperda CCB06]|uniref:Integral membrane n=1 Tax=Pyrenophora seminiperda CCB06 TaxID=1302712 RepID=A0A3M7M3H4_9PLEO|nr:integral membrane [Pyrenophora seminiperda CCB06]
MSKKAVIRICIYTCRFTKDERLTVNETPSYPLAPNMRSMVMPSPEEISKWPPPNYTNPEKLHAVVLGFTIPSLILTIVCKYNPSRVRLASCETCPSLFPLVRFARTTHHCMTRFDQRIRADEHGCLVLGIRFYGKGFLRRILGLDDYIMFAAMAFALPVTIFPMVSLNLGLGMHIWDLRPEWYTPYWKMVYAADLLFPMACSLTKISVCLTYLNLFPSASTKKFCYTMGIFISCYTVACVFMSLFQCSPITAYWDPNVEPTCIDMGVALEVIAALNSFSDCVVYLWPAKPLWSLQLPIRQRLGLIGLFSVGLCVCITGILRMYYLKVFFESYDMHWHGTAVWIVMVLEVDIGIICGCLSGVKPVMGVLFPALFGSSQHSQSGEGTRKTTHGRPNTHHSFMFKPLSEVSSKKGDRVSINEVDAQSSDGHDTTTTTSTISGQKPSFTFAIVQTQLVQAAGGGGSVPTHHEQSPTVEHQHKVDDLSSESGEWYLQRARRKSSAIDDKNGTTNTSDTASEEWILPPDGKGEGFA